MFPMVIVLRDAADIQEQSRSRRKLKQMLERAGIPLTDITVTYPEAAERTIEKHQPNVIVTMGTEAFQYLYETEQPLGPYRGELLVWNPECLDCDRYIDDHRSDDYPGGHHEPVKLIPTFHPGFVTQNWANQETIEYDLIKAYNTSHTCEMPMLLGDNYTVITTIDELEDLPQYISASKYCAFDIETEGLNTFEDDKILCVQFSTQEGEGIVVPLNGAWKRHAEDTYSDWQLANYFWRWVEHKDGTLEKVLSKDADGPIKVSLPCFPAGSVVCRTPEVHKDKTPKGHHCWGSTTQIWTEEEYPVVVALLTEIFEESDCTFVAHNGKFDVKGLWWQLGIRVRHFLFDTILAYHQFHEEFPHNLELCRSRFTYMPNYDRELKAHLPKVDKKHLSYATVPNEVLWRYGAADADVELRLVMPLLEEIRRDNPENGEWLFNNIDVPYNRALLLIENNGIKVDMDRFTELSEFYQQAISDLKSELDKQLSANGWTPLDAYNNSNTLRPLLFEKTYTVVVQEEKWRKCRKCKATGCEECWEGMIKVAPEVSKTCHGMGIPSELVPKTELTDLEKTDQKAFKALTNWCAEKTVHTTRTDNNFIARVPTTRPLSEKELARRQAILKALRTIQQYKKAVQARNLFLEGDPDKEIEGAQAMLAHIKRDGRIHPEYKQLTTSARLSCVNPNLQNIANEDEEGGYFYGKGIRTIFVSEYDE